MIGLNELYALVAENELKKAELEAENRVLEKLINIEKSKCVEQPYEETAEEVVEESEQQLELQDC
jgi:hypothetical protein